LVDVEQWAELRREHFVRGVSIKELVRRTGLSRNTVRAALRATEPPAYSRAVSASKLDPFKDEIHRLLKDDADLPGQRVRELIAPLGFDGGKTIVDDYLREVRPLFAVARTYQRTIYRSGEICQFDLWETAREVPVGHGQTRKAYVVVACLGYSRAGAGALIFSKQTEDLLFGIGRCLWSLGALPKTLVSGSVATLRPGGPRLQGYPSSGRSRPSGVSCASAAGSGASVGPPSRYSGYIGLRPRRRPSAASGGIVSFCTIAGGFVNRMTSPYSWPITASCNGSGNPFALTLPSRAKPNIDPTISAKRTPGMTSTITCASLSPTCHQS